MYDIAYNKKLLSTKIITKERIIMAEATENAEVAVEQKKSGGSNLLLIIIAVMLSLILIGGAVGAYLLLSEDEAVLNDASSAVQAQTAVKNTATAVQTAATERSQRGTDYTNIGPMYPLDPFIVNLFSEDGSRYLKTSINLELGMEELATELDAKKPLIRDIIIKALSAKSYEEISTIAGKENLKDEIVANVNGVLKDGKINNVFFTDFVIQ